MYSQQRYVGKSNSLPKSINSSFPNQFHCFLCDFKFTLGTLENAKLVSTGQYVWMLKVGTQEHAEHFINAWKWVDRSAVSHVVLSKAIKPESTPDPVSEWMKSH